MKPSAESARDLRRQGVRLNYRAEFLPAGQAAALRILDEIVRI